MSAVTQDLVSRRYQFGESIVSMTSRPGSTSGSEVVMALGKKSIFLLNSQTGQKLVQIISDAESRHKELYSFDVALGQNNAWCGIVSILNKGTDVIDEVKLFENEKIISVASSDPLTLYKETQLKPNQVARAEHNVCMDEDLNFYVVNILGPTTPGGIRRDIMNSTFQDASLAPDFGINRRVAAQLGGAGQPGTYTAQNIKVTQRNTSSSGTTAFFVGTTAGGVVGLPGGADFVLAPTQPTDTINFAYDYGRDHLTALMNSAQADMNREILLCGTKLRFPGMSQSFAVGHASADYSSPYGVSSAIAIPSDSRQIGHYVVARSSAGQYQVMVVNSLNYLPTKIPAYQNNQINCMYQSGGILYVGDDTGISAYQEITTDVP